ncbi:MAG: sulfotransferase domain-containing protein, partial [Halofilum sp. (in: g-proteobacteria)]
ARGQTLFITCMPKSGSTFLLQALKEATGYTDAMLTYAYERNEQDLYLPRLIDRQYENTVTRHHTRASGPNLELFHRFDIRPVVLVRDLLDVAVSVRDHLLLEGHRNFPALYAPSSYTRMGSGEQLDFVVDHSMPWYVQYYAGWYEAWESGELDMLWLRYEELVADWSHGIARILEFHGLGDRVGQVEAAIAASYQSALSVKRLNRGVVGRGQLELSAAQRSRIRDLACYYYRDVEFSFVGL